MSKRIKIYIFISLLVFLSYSPLMDDPFLVLQNRDLGKIEYLSYDYLISQTSQDKHFRPFFYVILIFVSPFIKASFLGFHVLSLLFFCMFCLLMYEFILLLFEDEQSAFLAVSLFAVHPINVMMAGYVTGSLVSVYGIFLQLSGITLIYWCKKRQKVFYYLSVLFYILSILCHEVAFIGPLYLLMILWVLNMKDKAKIFPAILPFAAVFIFFVVFRSWHASLYVSVFKVIQTSGVSFLSYFPSLLNLYTWYVLKLIFLRDITFIWNIDVPQGNLVVLNLLFIGIAAFVIFLIVKNYSNKIFVLGISLFMIGFIPSSLAIFTMPTLGLIIEPHWFYFSSTGFFILVSQGFLILKKKIPLRVWQGVFVLLILGCIFITRGYNSKWMDQKSFCEDWLRISPGNPHASFYLAESLMEQKEYARALEYFRQIIERTHHHWDWVYYQMGLTYIELDDLVSAKQYLLKAFQVNPSSALALNALGTVSFREKDLKAAREYFLKALEKNSYCMPAMLNLADLYWMSEQKDKALDLYQEILHLDPFHKEREALILKLAVLLFEKQRFAPARPLLESFIKEFPENREGYLLYGIALGNSGDLDKAILVWQKGKQLDPQDERFLKNITEAQALLQGSTKSPKE